MQRRELVRILEEAGFISRGGTNHGKFVKGDELVLVKRHREIEDQIAKRILRQAGLREPRPFGATSCITHAKET